MAELRINAKWMAAASGEPEVGHGGPGRYVRRQHLPDPYATTSSFRPIRWRCGLRLRGGV